MLRTSSLIFMICFACVLQAEVADISFARLPTAQLGGGWSPAKKDGEISYRVAQKTNREFYVKAWWEKGKLRPPAGTYYVAELRYKDSFKHPAVFSSGAGLAAYAYLSEIHRFGGSGDGKWKTAEIPLSWEYICRRIHPTRSWRNKADMAFFAVGGREAVPLASFKLKKISGKALEQLRKRYYSEIRHFNAMEQARARKKHPSPSADGSIAGLKNKLAAFPWLHPQSLLPNYKPGAGEIGKPLKIRMGIGEIESIPFGVFSNGSDLTKVQYSLSPLKGTAGTLTAELTSRTAEYSLLRRGKSWFYLPQRMWPAYTIAKIAKNRSWYFEVNVRSKKGKTKAGIYKGKLSIESEEGKTTLPVTLEVLPLEIPSMDELGLYFGGCTTGLVPVSDIKFQVAYNQNASNLWYDGFFPYNKALKKDGTMLLDYTYMDDWLPRARKAGLSKVVYFLGGSPMKYPASFLLARELCFFGQEEKGKNTRWNEMHKWMDKQTKPGNRNKLLPETRKRYVQWVKQFMAHAREKKWPEMILTPFDEPASWGWRRGNSSTVKGSIGCGPWIQPYFKDCSSAIHEADPKARIYASIHSLKKNYGTTFLPDVEVFCTNAIIQNEKAPDLVRRASQEFVKKGKQAKEFWQYSFTGYSRPEYIRYTLGFFFGYYNARGGLLWAYNWEKGWDSTKSGWRYAWQTPLGTIPGIFFEGVREGLDDRRLIEVYKKRFSKDTAKMAWLKDLLKQARKARGESGRSRVNDFWTGIKNPSQLPRWRDALLDRLVKKK